MKFKTKKRVYEISLAKRIKHIRFNFKKNFRGAWGLNILGIILKSKPLRHYTDGCRTMCYATSGRYSYGEIKL